MLKKYFIFSFLCLSPCAYALSTSDCPSEKSLKQANITAVDYLLSGYRVLDLHNQFDTQAIWLLEISHLHKSGSPQEAIDEAYKTLKNLSEAPQVFYDQDQAYCHYPAFYEINAFRQSS